MSTFRKLNRKQKKLFNKLSDEEKANVLMDEINKITAAETRKVAAESITIGFLLASDIYYKKYVEPYLKDVSAGKEEPASEIILKLINEIEMNHKKYVESHRATQTEDKK